MEIVDAVLAGERLALARLLTQVENDTPSGRSALDALFPHTGKAHLVGITGAPGTGKSSLVNQVTRLFRRPPAASGAQPRKVAIVAIDPSSPFTGGALLGDRVRMRDLAGDPGIFIRSMAARGALGGLARATAAAVQVFDAAGYEIILIETVGAGQNEVDIAGLAHTTLVVDTPGMGDDIQAIKAGILEIADILVINKADRPGLENTRALAARHARAGPPQNPPARQRSQPGSGLDPAGLEHHRHHRQRGGRSIPGHFKAWRLSQAKRRVAKTRPPAPAGRAGGFAASRPGGALAQPRASGHLPGPGRAGVRAPNFAAKCSIRTGAI